MTQPVQTTTRLDPTRRLARKVMPFIASDSALLPPDSWIISTLKDMYKSVPVFRRDVRAAGALAALVAGGVMVSVGGGIALAATGALTLASGLGVVAVLGATAGYAAWRGKKLWARAQSETALVLKEDIGKRYAAYKMEEIASAWRARRDAARAAKQNAPVSAPTPAAPAAPVADSAQQPARKAASIINLSGIFGRSKSAPKDHAAPKATPPATPPKP